MSRILVGTASWTGEGLRGTFYPEEIAQHDMLRFYAQHFPLVEVDATYYHMPGERTARSWAARTPPDFVFDVKAYRALTLHDRDVIPTADDFQRFASALRPLAGAGKLGAVLFQFPPWFRRGHDAGDYLGRCRDLMPADYRLAVEFRHGSWVAPGAAEETFALLRGLGLAFVGVDEPQFRASTVPPLAVATAPLAVVRFHGRNYAAWFKRDVGVEERFNYLYSLAELAEWLPKVRHLADEADEVHVLMNNCHRDYAVRNARQIAELLDVRLPRPDAAAANRPAQLSLPVEN